MAVSIFWDCQNVRMSPNAIPLFLDFVFRAYGKVEHKLAYAYWRQESEQFENAVYHTGFECRNIPSFEKNSVDNALICDCENYAHENKLSPIIVLISGDRDYVQLVQSLKRQGKKVIVVGHQQTTSKKLIRAASEFYAVEAILRYEHFAA